MRGSPLVTVVIPTFRRPDRAERLLDALDRQTLDPARFEVIVVDDCSGDDTVGRLLLRIPGAPYRLRVLRTDVNGGPAAARNLGWRAAEAAVIAFIDDDCVPAPGWLEAGMARFDVRPGLGVLQGHTRVPDEVDTTTVAEFTVCRYVHGESPMFEGCNIFYRREALASTRGFDEEIRWWGEDTTVGWQVVEAGWQRGFARDAVAVHDVENRGFRWHVRNSYLERNVVRLAARHPGFRRDFCWRRWAVRPEDAALVLALGGLLLGRWSKPLALAVLPYAWIRRPALRQPRIWPAQARVALLDAARCAGHLVGSVRHKVFLL